MTPDQWDKVVFATAVIIVAVLMWVITEYPLQ
jgi:hypothetical protein